MNKRKTAYGNIRRMVLTAALTGYMGLLLAQTSIEKEALQSKIVSENGEKTTLENVLQSLRGKVVVMDIWASWCSDCIKGMPQMKALREEKENADVAFLFLSVDKETSKWKKGMKKYAPEGHHYRFAKGWKSAFNQAIHLDWTPRYLILDRKGNIALHKAIVLNDPIFQRTLNELTSN